MRKLNKQEYIALLNRFQERDCGRGKESWGDPALLAYTNAIYYAEQLDEPSALEGCEKIYCKTYDLKGYKCFNCSKCGAWQVDLPNTRVCTFCGRPLKAEETK